MSRIVKNTLCVSLMTASLIAGGVTIWYANDNIEATSFGGGMGAGMGAGMSQMDNNGSAPSGGPGGGMEKPNEDSSDSSDSSRPTPPGDSESSSVNSTDTSEPPEKPSDDSSSTESTDSSTDTTADTTESADDTNSDVVSFDGQMPDDSEDKAGSNRSLTMPYIIILSVVSLLFSASLLYLILSKFSSQPVFKKSGDRAMVYVLGTVVLTGVVATVTILTTNYFL